MSLSDYLAKNYLTADSEKKPKKRKRKNKDGGLKIDDDDDLGFKKAADDDDGDLAPMIAGTTASKKSKKKSRDNGTAASWTAVGVSAPSHAAQLAADTAAADAIIASTAADRKTAADAEDEAPEMVDTEGHLKMDSGGAVGLQTAAQVTASMKKKKDEEKQKEAEIRKDIAERGIQETIYRDASGRIINVAMKRAEARKKALEEERKKREKERAARGDVQNAEAEKRKAELDDAKYLTVARYADDGELNDELEEVERWNDPAMGFMRKKKAGKSITGKPLYQGAFQPNRYGIRPGHRWDGVDRGNGFESQWFQARNQKANVEKLQYQWQMDE